MDWTVVCASMSAIFSNILAYVEHESKSIFSMLNPLSYGKYTMQQSVSQHAHTAHNTHPHTHMYTYAHTCKHMYTHPHTCTHMYTHPHTCTHMYTHPHKCTHMYTHPHTCTHMYTHPHMQKLARIHTHAHVNYTLLAVNRLRLACSFSHLVCLNTASRCSPPSTLDASSIVTSESEETVGKGGDEEEPLVRGGKEGMKRSHW